MRVPREWVSFSCIALGATLTGLNLALVDVILPAVSSSLQADTFAATWFVLAYGLMTCAFILSFGRLADIAGRKWIYIAGLVAMGAAGLLCAAADAPWMFITGRLIQGLGGAMVLANSTAILVDVFPRAKLSTALGFNVAFVAGAQASAPILSGYIEVTYGWRSIFVLTAGVAVAASLWAAVNLPGIRGRGASFDFAGAALSVASVVLVLLTLSRAPVTGWPDPLTLLCLVAGVFAVIAFLLSQRMVREPLVSPIVFADRSRALGLLATFLMALPRASIVLLVSLTLQILHGSTAFEAGQMTFFAALGLMAASPFAGVMIQLIGSYAVQVIAPLIALCGLGVILASGLEQDAICIAGLVLVGVGSAWFMTPNTTTIMMSVATEHRGVTNGLRATFQAGGNAFSAVIVMSVLPAFIPMGDRQNLLDAPRDQLAREALINGQHLVVAILMALCLASSAIAAVRRPANPVS